MAKASTPKAGSGLLLYQTRKLPFSEGQFAYAKRETQHRSVGTTQKAELELMIW